MNNKEIIQLIEILIIAEFLLVFFFTAIYGLRLDRDGKQLCGEDNSEICSEETTNSFKISSLIFSFELIITIIVWFILNELFKERKNEINKTK